MGRDTLIINPFEYEFLTDTWDGPKGTAFNACYEFLKEEGLCDERGEPTRKGWRQVELYEDNT